MLTKNYLSDKHKADLYGSGLTDEIIEDIGFYTCNADEAKFLLDRQDINCECLVIPYPHIEDFFRLKPDGIILGRDGKPSKYLQRSGTDPHLFVHPAIYTALYEDDNLPILIVEGEKKALKATQDFYFEEPIFKPICFGGVWNWRTHTRVFSDNGEVKNVPIDIPDFKNLPVDGKIFYICFDSDAEVNEQVQHAEEALSANLVSKGAKRVVSIRIPYNGVKLGIDDYLVKYGRDEFKKLIEQSSSNIAVRATIKLIRKLPNRTATDKLDEISLLVINDLKLNGKFFNDITGAYFFSNKSKRILNVEEEKFQMQLANEYGLYRVTSEFKSILSKVQEHCIYEGEKTTIKNFAYFDRDNSKTVVYDNNGAVYEIAPAKSVAIRSNGSGGIFFRHREYETINYSNNQKGFFKEYILNALNFQANENTLLTHEQQLFLFTVWFYSLFYPNLMPSKPILVMTGDYGSGKSTSQLLVGKLLFGDSFNLSTIHGEKDFLTSVINKYYLAYDNVDINTEWVRNAIASLSTGFKVEVRKLYTDMEMFQAEPISYLALNSMSQSLYKRPDVANRLLIFRTAKIDNYIPLNLLISDVLEHRNEILSEVFDTLGAINKYINNKYVYTGQFRMADFANLGYKISTAFGREKEFEAILKIMAHEQSTISLEDDAIVELISRWLNIRTTITFISTGELYGELSKIASDTKINFPFKSVASFGQALNTSFANLNNIFLVNRTRGHANKMMWDIRYK